jgi:hypothetical protein
VRYQPDKALKQKNLALLGVLLFIILLLFGITIMRIGAISSQKTAEVSGV